MSDIEHPMIREIERYRYPDKCFLDWEREEALKGGEEDGEDTDRDRNNDRLDG